MKTSRWIFYFLFSFYASGIGFSRDFASAFEGALEKHLFDDTGIILAAADFWISFPAEQNASPFLKISPGTRVKILAKEKEFFRIEHRNIMGYVRKSMVRILGTEPLPSQAEEPTALQKPVPGPDRQAAAGSTGRYFLAQATSLRTGPDSQASVLLRFTPGDEVEVLDSTGKYWWKVRYHGQTGWAKSALMKKN